MSNNLILDLIKQIDSNQLCKNLFSLSKEPLPYRKLNYTVPGDSKNTLYQADDFIQKKLESWGYTVEKEGVEVRTVNSEESPWFTAYNLYAKKLGVVHPEEIILFLSHKDSQS